MASEETDRLARDARRPVSFTGHMLPIISESLNQSVDRLGKFINDFGKYLDDTTPEVSNNKENNNDEE